MSKFIKIKINKKEKKYLNIKYIPSVIKLYEKFSKYLNDDYFDDSNLDVVDKIIDLIERCGSFFWVVIEKKTNRFTGFVFLDNLAGNAKNIHSAEVTTCFEPRYWGKYTKYCAKKFINYCFKKYKLIKLKATVFPQNFRVKGYLKKIGFKFEAALKAETLKNKKMQNIEIYSIINPHINVN